MIIYNCMFEVFLKGEKREKKKIKRLVIVFLIHLVSHIT